jgi:hypothetical protein
MPFVKLDCGILDSSLWSDPGATRVFLAMLLMATPRHLPQDEPVLALDSTISAGWAVPAGWYGFVAASASGVLRRAGVGMDEGMEALRALAGPDAESRTASFDGRRIARVDGGWAILNFMKYRDRDHTAAERMQRYRNRLKEQRAVTPSVTDATSTVAQAEAEAEAEAEKKKSTRSRAAARPEDVPAVVWTDFLTLRKQRRAPVTETVIEGIRREAAAAGMSLEQALRTCVERGWQSFKADWAQSGGRLAPAKQAQHVPNMPLGHASCSCPGCSAYRRAKEALK